MAAPRGRFTTGTSRTGAGFNYGGRNFRYPGASGLKLDWKGPDVQKFMEAVVESVAATLQTRGEQLLKSLAAVDTGYMRDHSFVRIEQQGSRLKLTLGSEAPYTIFVEMGTSRMPAQPFIRPSFVWMAANLTQMLRAEAQARGFGGGGLAGGLRRIA